MRILVWHVHGGWMDGFVRGEHEYLLVLDANGDGGRGQRDWPENVVDVPRERVRDLDVDVVVLQRLEELDVAEELLGRRLGREVPAIFVEHNTPKADVPNSRHPLADQRDILIAHVTQFNGLYWDCGSARTTVIEHGVPDPGALYTGELPRSGVVINEPVRRWRVTGSDLIGGFAQVGPVDVFGMKADSLGEALGASPGSVVAAGDLPTPQLHRELARRRLYLHTPRWTSLGLSLLEAMHLGMPIVGIDATDIRRAVPPEAGCISTDVSELHRAVARLLDDPSAARAMGRAAREFALEHFGLARFLRRWDEVLDDEVSHWLGSSARASVSARQAG